MENLLLNLMFGVTVRKSKWFQIHRKLINAFIRSQVLFCGRFIHMASSHTLDIAIKRSLTWCVQDNCFHVLKLVQVLFTL